MFSMNDPNEPPNDAAVLVAPIGKGTYVYTTFSFFRQLPAGNPGAARLFINLLSADQRATSPGRRRRRLRSVHERPIRRARADFAARLPASCSFRC